MLRQKPPVIMVIQGDDLWRYRLADFLRQAGAYVESFSTAGQAFEHLEANAVPDLVVVDAHAPDLAGVSFPSVFADLRASSCMEIPVLAVSAAEEPPEAGQVIGLTDATAFLRLPCPDMLLLDLADMLLHGSSASGRPLVLVADDSVALRKVLASNLESHGYHIVEAADGAETLRLARELRPDVIILDHILPDTMGLAILPHLLSYSKPFVIVITGDPTPSLAEEYSRLGAQAFIRKPFNVGSIAGMIGMSCRLRPQPGMAQSGEDQLGGADFIRERYEDLFGRLPFGAAVFEPLDGGLDFAFIDINPVAAKLLGLRADSVVDGRLSQAMPASLDAGLIDAMRQAFEGASARYFSFAGSADARLAGLGSCLITPLITSEVAVVFTRLPDA